MNRDRFPAMVARSGGWCVCGEWSLYLQADAKTSPAVTVDKSGTAHADIHNAFILPVGPLESGGACRCVTLACKGCYAAGMENVSGALARNASTNLETLLALYGSGGRAGFARVVSALVALVEHSANQQTARGIVSPCFRWHSGGDIFAPWYARAIRQAMTFTPSIDHWIYTRDAVNVRGLLPVPDNARVFLSVDRYNAPTMARASVRFGLPLALLADDQRDAVAVWAMINAIAPQTARPFECPATGVWTRDGLDAPAHVVGIDGRRATVTRNAPAIGACVACQRCLPGGKVSPITFLQHGGKPNPNGRGKLGAAVAVRIRRAGEMIA